MNSTFAQDIAEIITDGFSEYRNEFKAITGQAKRRFENAEWIAAKQASIDRIELYDVFAASVVEKIRKKLAGSDFGDGQWSEVKRAYTSLITHRKDYDLAETVFNTVYRKLFDRPNVGDDKIYTTSPFTKPPVVSKEPVFNSYRMDKLVVGEQFIEQFPERFDYRYWQGLQENVKGNWMMDVFPYRREQRFEHND